MAMLALAAAGIASSTATISPKMANVLVVGGSGRVGGSTVRWLHKLAARENMPMRLAVGGRDPAAFEANRQRLGLGRDDLQFESVDLDGGDDALAAACSGRSLIVHTAGPFQQREDPALMRAAIAAGVPYCDVCDELVLARNAKALSASAADAGVPCIVSCGIWPGVSALMAAEAVAQLGGQGACERLEFSFFTAGTGGAGPTIVSATFLLLATEVITYVDGVQVSKEPWTERRVADFGGGIGERECYLLDNPDVPTSAEALGVANAASRFGTTPTFWNSLFGGMKAIPQSLLADRGKMQGFALFSMPIIRIVDALVGATNAMRVDAWPKGGGGPPVTIRVAHNDLEECVGQATAAFGLELLRETGTATIEPGVWFPAELQKLARTNILEKAREGAFVWDGFV